MKIAALILVLLLTACGGGEDFQTKATTIPADCGGGIRCQ